MSDTQRSAAELAALLADNTSGAITPQMLRDFLESAHPSHGGLHFTDPGVPTTIAQQSTFVPVANTGDVLNIPHRFDQPVTGRLRYTGRVATHSRIMFTGSISSPAANNQICRLAIALNGVPQTPSITRTKLGSAGDTQAIALSLELELNPNDYLEVWISNDSSASNLTVEHGYLSALCFLS